MTVVISVLTQDWVMQASDRRLVWLDPDGGVRPRDDAQNKAVLFANRLVFAYTGIADIGPYRQKTDRWLAEQLASATPAGQDDVLEALANATTARLRHGRIQAIPRARRGHEFVACGWARFPAAPDVPAGFRPYIALVTNLREAGGALRDAPADECVLLWHALGPEEEGSVWISGQQLEPDAHRALVADLGATGLDPGGVGAVLITHVRRFSDRNEAVGRGVLLSALPRAALQPAAAGMLLLAALPLAETATFMSVSPDADDPVTYGPILVTESGGVVAGFVAGPLGSTPGLPAVTSAAPAEPSQQGDEP